MTPVRALLYCRLSDPSDPNAPTLDTQEVLLRGHCEERGYEVVGALREAHTAALLRERPQIREALALADARAFDVLLVRDLDRLTRSMPHLWVLRDYIEQRGARIEFVLKSYEDTPEGRLMLNIDAFVAEVEREKIRWRTVTGKRRRLETGKLHNGGIEKYGLIRDKERGVRSINEAEATIVRQVFDWVALEGLSERAVVRRLIERGIAPPATGKITYERAGITWAKSQIHRMLTDPTYKGEEFGWRRTSKGNGLMAERPRAEWIALPDGITPAIVDPAIWEQAQERLRTNSGATTRNALRQVLLRGRVRCLVCGLPMRAETNKIHSRVDGSVTSAPVIYRCSSREVPGRKCKGSQVVSSWLHQRVWARVLRYLKRGETALSVAQKARAAAPDHTLHLRRRLAKLETEHRNYVRLYGEADTERQRTAAKIEMARVARLIEDAEKSLEAARTDASAQQTGSTARLQREAYLASVRERADSLDFDGQAEALAWLDVVVYVSGRDYRVEAVVPL